LGFEGYAGTGLDVAFLLVLRIWEMWIREKRDIRLFGASCVIISKLISDGRDLLYISSVLHSL
jgi:hypothetical protein